MVEGDMKQCEILRELQRRHGNRALSKTSVNRWVRVFRDGDGIADPRAGRGRPTVWTPEKIQELKDAVAEDPSKSCRVLAEELHVGSVHRALKKHLHLKKRPAAWSPHLLTPGQHLWRSATARRVLSLIRRTPSILERTVTGDESWFHCYEPLSKRNSSQWLATNEPRPHKPRLERNCPKLMLVVFWDCKGIILRRFMPNGVGITAAVYLGIMRDLRESIRRRRPNLWARQRWFLHHDNAPAHRAMIIQNFLQQTHTRILEQPPYSPDLAPQISGCLTGSRRN